MHKTGSSSIQATLRKSIPAANGDTALLKLPSVNVSGPLRTAFDDADRYIRARTALLGEAAIREKVALQRGPIRAKIRAFFEENRDRRVIVSAEGFDNLSEQSLREFLELVPHRRIRAICYIRSPQGSMASALQQRVKAGRASLRLSALLPKYRRVLEKYRTTGLTFEPRLFDRSALLNGCVVQDFHARAGLKLAPRQVVTSNESISRDAVGLLWVMNRWRVRQDLPPLRTTRLADWLKTVPGGTLGLSRAVYEAAAAEMSADIAWAEALLGTRFAIRDSQADAIGSIAELDTVSDAGRAWLDAEAPAADELGAQMNAAVIGQIEAREARRRARQARREAARPDADSEASPAATDLPPAQAQVSSSPMRHLARA